MLTGQTDGGNFWRKSFFSHVCSDLYQFDENCNIVLLVNLDIQKHYSKSESFLYFSSRSHVNFTH